MTEMRTGILTFVDSGVLIAAARADDPLNAKALRILLDPNRRFASSIFVQLEVLPKARFHKNEAESSFYGGFFARVEKWVDLSHEFLGIALEEACVSGLSAIDAIHVVSAKSLNVHEFITSEGPKGTIHRTRVVPITSIRA